MSEFKYSFQKHVLTHHDYNSLYDSSTTKGVDCVFIKINNEYGIKVFKSANMAQDTFELQNKFHEHGFAPKAFDKFSFPEKRMFGYFTECIDYLAADFASEIKDIYYPACSVYKEIEEMYLPKLKRAIYKIDSAWSSLLCDLHCKNWGFKDGQPMLIDFSAA